MAWPLLLLGLGLAFLVAEAFVPSGGLLFLLSSACLGLGLYQAFRHSSERGALFLAADVVLVPLVGGLALYLWQKSPMAAKMTLKAPVADEFTVAHAHDRLDSFVGTLGLAATTLRPSGLVELAGRRYDAAAEAGLIDEGTAVEVVSVRSGRLVVRPAESDPA